MDITVESMTLDVYYARDTLPRGVFGPNAD